MKIELDKIKSTIIENGVEEDVADAIVTQLEAEAALEGETVEVEEDTPTNEDLTDGEENLPKVKYEYVIVLNDKEGYLKDKEIAGWVLQQEENADAGLVVSKISDAVKDQNAGMKRKRNNIDDLTSAFEYLKPKFLKNKKLKIKTKDLTRVIVATGKLY